jgi:hypothetical protein
LVTVHAEPPGQFTAQVVGLPEVRATAMTREQAINQVLARLSEMLASGDLVCLELPTNGSRLWLPPPIDPNSPVEQEYLEELARMRQEDLEQTLRQYELEDQQCPGSSSTPTT